MSFYIEKRDSKNQISSYHEIDCDRFSIIKKEGKYLLKIYVNSFKDKQSCEQKYLPTMVSTYSIECPELERVFTLEVLKNLLKSNDEFKNAREA